MTTIQRTPLADTSVLIRLIDNVWHQGQLKIIDELYERDYVGHDPFRPVPLYGPRQLHKHIATVRAAFPDVQLEVDDVVVAADRIAYRYVARATNTGPLGQLPPTGRQVTIAGLQIMRFGSSGQVAEDWNCWDTLGLLRQIRATTDTDLTQGLWCPSS